jgi:hypothetical protein
VNLRSYLLASVDRCARESRKIAIGAQVPRETQPHNRGGVFEDTATRQPAENVTGAKFENGALF